MWSYCLTLWHRSENLCIASRYVVLEFPVYRLEPKSSKLRMRGAKRYTSGKGELNWVVAARNNWKSYSTTLLVKEALIRLVLPKAGY